MKQRTTVPTRCAALAALSVHASLHAQPGGAKAMTGPRVGAAWGAAIGKREIDDPRSRNDEGIGCSAKICVGYRLSEHCGVQAGVVRLHELNQHIGARATRVRQTVNGRSSGVAGTARLPLGHRFALTGKRGLAFGKVTGASPSTAAATLRPGSRTSLLVGTGAERTLDHAISPAVEPESHGKRSTQVKGNALTTGSRLNFWRAAGQAHPGRPTLPPNATRS